MSQVSFHVDESADDLVNGLCGSDADELGDGHLEDESGAWGTGDLVVHVEHDLKGADEHIWRDVLGDVDELVALVIWDVEVSP